MIDFIQTYLPNVYRMGWSGQAGWGTAIYLTLYMTFISFVIGGLLGLIAGLLLVLTAPGGIIENKLVFHILDKITSIFRAIPFIILLALINPFTRMIVGTGIGPTAALVPLSLAVFPFFARQVQVVLSELDRGVIEAAQASGATFWDIVGVYLREGLPDLIRVTTVTLISLVGETAMAGAIGAGGLGNVAISYGYQRFNNDVTLLATFWDIVGVYLREGLPDLIRVTTVTLISLVGETAMAGAIGAGGLGNVAISYGYQRFNNDVTLLATFLILLLIFFIQFIGDFLTKKISHR